MCGISAAREIKKILETQEEILTKTQNLESTKKVLEEQKGKHFKCEIEVAFSAPNSFDTKRVVISEEALMLAVEHDLSEIKVKSEKIEIDIVNMSKQITQG